MTRLILTALLTLNATPLFAQQPSTVADQRVTVAAGIDVRNAYMFRGVRQDNTGTIAWPSADVGLGVHAAEHGLTSARVHVGTFNSLHSGWAGAGGPSGKSWYESDVYTTLSLGFANAVALDTTFTGYRSPNDMFTTVKELSFKATVDRPIAGGASLAPYALVAFELDTEPGIGQLDGGFKAGKYLELGTTPGHSLRRVGIAVPVKVGLSIGNYYELAGEDHPFGFVSVAGIATMPIGRWINVHGGAQFEHLGTTTKAFNGGDASEVTASIGVAFVR
jgi:hypothetical protein